MYIYIYIYIHTFLTNDLTNNFNLFFSKSGGEILKPILLKIVKNQSKSKNMCQKPISYCTVGAAHDPPPREFKILSGIVKTDLWAVQDFVSKQSVPKLIHLSDYWLIIYIYMYILCIYVHIYIYIHTYLTNDLSLKTVNFNLFV